MGFKRCCHYFDAIHMGFYVAPLKTHANTVRSLFTLLKTHAYSIKRKSKSSNILSKVLKTHAYSSNYCSPDGAETRSLAGSQPQR